MWFLCSRVVVVLAVPGPPAQSLLAHPHLIDWLYMYPISQIKKYSRNYGLCAIHPTLTHKRPPPKKTIQHLWHILINLNLLVVMHKSVKRIWIVEIHVIWPMPSKNEIQSNAKTTTTKSACWQRNNQRRSVSRSPKSMLVILWTWYTHIQIQVQVQVHSLGLGARVFSINKWIYDWMHFKFDRKKG